LGTCARIALLRPAASAHQSRGHTCHTFGANAHQVQLELAAVDGEGRNRLELLREGVHVALEHVAAASHLERLCDDLGVQRLGALLLLLVDLLPLHRAVVQLAHRVLSHYDA